MLGYSYRDYRNQHRNFFAYIRKTFFFHQSIVLIIGIIAIIRVVATFKLILEQVTIKRDLHHPS